MTDIVDVDTEQSVWRLRTIILLMLGGVAAWFVWWIMDLGTTRWETIDPSVFARHSAEATGVAVAVIAFGFGLERIRVRWTIGFALALGVVAGLIVWWNNQPNGVWNWSGASLFLAIAIAMPLFQVARDQGRWSFPYSQIHGHAWTNVVLWFACWAFAGISMLLTFLMSELFQLIGITFLHDLLQDHGWFSALIIGSAFGAALGMFRDLDHVVRLLQRVVTSVLSVLAPVLGAGLVIFLLALPFTGLHTLWEATRSTTPILITCVIGALILANAVLGHGPDDEAKNPVLRWGAMALGVAMLPLAIVAAVATGLRISEYGFTPDRLWALVFIVLATVYGLVYLVALVRKRQDWAVRVRPDNVRLAFATMALALVLATPLIGFNSISANSQVARLSSGKVSADKFDWAALAYDFGEPGRTALERLTASRNPVVKAKAGAALKADSRYVIELASEADEDRFKGRFDVRPAGATLPDALRNKIAGTGSQLDVGMPCRGNVLCRVYMQTGSTSAAVVGDGCMSLPPADRIDPKHKCSVDTAVFVLRGADWINSNDLEQVTEPKMTPDQERASLKRERDAIDAGEVEVRDVVQQQLFIGDKPIGQPFKRP